MKKINVFVCDDMPFVCQYFTIILNQVDDINLVGTAESEQALFESFEHILPDIVLLDIQMQYDDEGLDILKHIKNTYPDIKVIMLSVHEDDDFIFRSFSLGASDYIIKSDDLTTVADTIRNVYYNKNYLNPYISKKIIDGCIKAEERYSNTLSLLHCIALLTSSEYKILQLVYRGYSYADIAKQRFVEETTIRSQVNKILKKFNKKRMNILIEELKKISFFDFK